MNRQQHLRDAVAPDPVPDAEFSAFVRGRMQSLLRAAYVLTGDQHLAEDLVQTALARTHLAWSRLHRSGNAEAYARKVMYHHQISFWRRRRPAEALPGALPEAGDGADPAGRVATRVALWDALGRLTPKQRAILVLRFLEDRSEADTAMLLGVSPGTVKSQTSHALQRMRALAPDLGPLADEVVPVDLEPQARRASHAMARRRAASALAAVGVLLAAGLGVFLLKPGAGGPPADPTRSSFVSGPPTQTSEPPTPTAPPVLLPGPVRASAPYGCTGTAAPPPATSVAGELTYWHIDRSAKCILVQTLLNGQVRTLATIPTGDGYGPEASVTVSPDRTRVAWVSNIPTEPNWGDLAVLTVGDTTPRLIAGTIDYDAGVQPVWEADSRQIVVQTRDGTTFRVDTVTRAATQIAGLGRYVVHSPGGGTYDASGSLTEVTVTAKGAQFVTSMPYDGSQLPCKCGFAVQGVSDDARYVIVGPGSGVAQRATNGTTILDMQTKRAIPLPITVPAGESVRQILPRPGGGFAIVTAAGVDGVPTLWLVSAGKSVTTHALVPELAGSVLVGYR